MDTGGVDSKLWLEASKRLSALHDLRREEELLLFKVNKLHARVSDKLKRQGNEGVTDSTSNSICFDLTLSLHYTVSYKIFKQKNFIP